MKPYRDFADFLACHFEGKMQKLSVNAGFSCPNRDGTIGRGGCTYCNNRSFSPSYCNPSDPVGEQLRKGITFFSRKYPHMRYLAYFQAYTSTYGASAEALAALYRSAFDTPGIEGVVIGTRPDCVSPALLDAIAALPWAMVEYGAESSHDATLRAVNRGHTWAATEKAVRMTAERGIPVGLHLIMGLPGETEEMMMETLCRVNALPVDVVKMHQMQIHEGTAMAEAYLRGENRARLWTPEEYARFCAKAVRTLRPDIAIDRFVSQAPPEMLIAPRWGIKNYQFAELVARELSQTSPEETEKQQ